MTNLVLILLAVIAIGAPLIVMRMYLKLLKEKPDVGFDKFIEFFKWYIVSVVIVVAVTIVDSGIKEREQSISEMASFDKYLDRVIKKDSLNQRLELARYFATVIPSNSLRERWKALYDTFNRVTLIKEIADSSFKNIDLNQNIDTLSLALKNLNNSYTQIESEYAVKTPNTDSIQKLMAVIDNFKMVEQEKEAQVARFKETPNVVPKKKEYLIDVFYLESKPSTRSGAKRIEEQLSRMGYDARLRKLSDIINSRSGYQIYTNQIRVEQNNTAEMELGKEIQMLVGANLNIRQVTQSSPGYLSVFVVE